MFCASVTYPKDEEGRFDLDYFVQNHVPMFARLLGDNCSRYEVRVPAEAPGAPRPTYRCTACFWVTSGEAFGAVLATHGQEIYGDIARFTDLEPVRSWDEVVAASER